MTRLNSQEFRFDGVYGGLPGGFGDIPRIEQGGCHQGPVAVLRLLDAIQGEDNGNSVDGRIIVTGQAEMQIKFLTASDDQSRSVTLASHQLVSGRPVFLAVLLYAGIYTVDRQYWNAEVLPCE